MIHTGGKLSEPEDEPIDKSTDAMDWFDFEACMEDAAKLYDDAREDTITFRVRRKQLGCRKQMQQQIKYVVDSEHALTAARSGTRAQVASPPPR